MTPAPDITPDSEHRGLVAALPASIRPFALLARFDRPIGWWLLFWPGAWAVALAGSAVERWTLIVWLLVRPDETLWLRAMLMVGLLGGLTTFSALMVDVLLLWHEQARLPVLAAYLGSSLLGGLLAVWLGWRLGQHWFGGG